MILMGSSTWSSKRHFLITGPLIPPLALAFGCWVPRPRPRPFLGTGDGSESNEVALALAGVGVLCTVATAAAASASAASSSSIRVSNMASKPSSLLRHRVFWPSGKIPSWSGCLLPMAKEFRMSAWPARDSAFAAVAAVLFTTVSATRALTLASVPPAWPVDETDFLPTSILLHWCRKVTHLIKSSWGSPMELSPKFQSSSSRPSSTRIHATNFANSWCFLAVAISWSKSTFWACSERTWQWKTSGRQVTKREIVIEKLQLLKPRSQELTHCLINNMFITAAAEINSQPKIWRRVVEFLHNRFRLWPRRMLSKTTLPLYQSQNRNTAWACFLDWSIWFSSSDTGTGTGRSAATSTGCSHCSHLPQLQQKKMISYFDFFLNEQGTYY